MNILLLAKLDEKDAYLVDYVTTIFDMEVINLHVLNIVLVPGDIPVKTNGEVLDVCTEFDLSGYRAEQAEHQKQLDSYLADMPQVKREAKVGSGYQIIKSCIKEYDIDLVLSGAHVSNMVEDMFDTTFASHLMHETTVPYLSLKSNMQHKPVKQIAILRPYKQPEKENLLLVKMLQQKFDAQITLVKINTPRDRQDQATIHAQMQGFCELNELECTAYKVIEADDIMKALKQLVVDQQLDMLALGHLEGSSRGILHGELKAEILNHLMVPIYIY